MADNHPINNPSKVAIACVRCQTVVYRWPGQIRRAKKTYCSPACHYNTPDDPNLVDGKYVLQCGYCKKTLLRPPHEARAKEVFCSVACRAGGPNEVRIEGDLAYMTLTKGQTTVFNAKHLPLLQPFKWYAVRPSGGSYYAHAAPYDRETKRSKHVQMHRLITGIHGDLSVQVDHKNHDTLDNRDENLRVCTQMQNLQNVTIRPHNKSGYKGVSKVKHANVYAADIRANGKCYRLGNYKTAEEAARVYDEAARRLHGEFACVNFP